MIDRNEYDPRERPWYQAAVAAGRPTWSAIYPGASPPVPQITAVIPVYNPVGGLQGVLATDLTLQQIGDFLSDLKANQPGETFIVDRFGRMVASSTDEDPYITPDERREAVASEIPLIRSAAENILQDSGNFAVIQGREAFTFKDEAGERQFVEITPLQDDWGLDWLIVVVIPEAALMGPIYENVQYTVFLGFLILMVAVVLGWSMARWIIQPILTLIQAAATVESGEYEISFLESVSKRQDELGQLARVFQRMAQEVDTREKNLKHQLQQLHIEIDETKRQQQVKEIVDTDFFAELQAKANNIRQRREQQQSRVTPEKTG